MENSKAVKASWAVLTRALYDGTISNNEFAQMVNQHKKLVASENETPQVEMIVLDSRDRKLLIFLLLLAFIGMLAVICLIFLPLIYLANAS